MLQNDHLDADVRVPHIMQIREPSLAEVLYELNPDDTFQSEPTVSLEQLVGNFEIKQPAVTTDVLANPCSAEMRRDIRIKLYKVKVYPFYNKRLRYRNWRSKEEII